MSELIDARQQEPEEAGFTEIIRLIGASREKVMQAVWAIRISRSIYCSSTAGSTAW